MPSGRTSTNHLPFCLGYQPIKSVLGNFVREKRQIRDLPLTKLFLCHVILSVIMLRVYLPEYHLVYHLMYSL